MTDTSSVEGSGFGAFVLDGIDHDEFAGVMLKEFNINILSFTMEDDPSLKGLHLSPGLSNSIEEIDLFVEAAGRILDRSGSKLKQA